MSVPLPSAPKKRPRQTTNGSAAADCFRGDMRTLTQAFFEHHRSSGSRGVGPWERPRACRSAFSGPPNDRLTPRAAASHAYGNGYCAGFSPASLIRASAGGRHADMMLFGRLMIARLAGLVNHCSRRRRPRPGSAPHSPPGASCSGAVPAGSGAGPG